MKRRGGLLQLCISLVLLGVAIFALLHRQVLLDHFTVWQYQPSAAVVAITERTQLAEQGKFYFYASAPVVSGQQDFNAQCEHRKPDAVTLGCYYQQRIYLYNVSDQRLDGIKEVTAAHEMLHAAFDRLSNSERERVVKLLRQAADTLQTDRFAERFKVYAGEDRETQDTELHSILATEVETIDPQLETYYKQYFTNRQVVVKLFKQYEGVMADLKRQESRVVAEMNQLADSINSQSKQYEAAADRLAADIAQFNEQAKRAGAFSSQIAFEEARSALIARQQVVSSRHAAIQQLVQRYSQQQKELEALSLQSDSLYRSLDSTIKPAPSL